MATWSGDPTRSKHLLSEISAFRLPDHWLDAWYKDVRWISTSAKTLQLMFVTCNLK